MTVLALDFDGVLCDSARETGITGWKAARSLWEDIREPVPPASLLENYCRARPVIETGYEAIAMVRLLLDGEDPADLLEELSAAAAKPIQRSGLDVAGLKRLYGDVRDRWIRENPREWLSLSPLYQGTPEVLSTMPRGIISYIVTTKEERFVRQLLAHNGVDFPRDHIYGLDRGMKKEAVLRELIGQHPGHPVHFVEDRLATLKRLLAQPDMTAVRLHIACWGYNTEAQCQEAEHLKIHLLRALSLAEIANAEYDSDE